MRRCPECYEIYDDRERFCEVDGQRLLPDPALTGRPHDGASNTPNPRNVQQSWFVGLVGIVVGVLICSTVYIVYATWTIDTNPADQRSSFSGRPQEPLQSMRREPARAPQSTETSAEDDSPDSEAEASPETPSEPGDETQNQSVSARLNQGPVSTGPREKDGEKSDRRIQTIILMQDGTSVEVDAAWKDGQGVWYRRGGLVSFVESQRVKEITARAEPKIEQERDVAP